MLVSTGFSSAVSPRISFSHDLNQVDVLQIEKQQHYCTHPLDLNFDFCVSKCLEQSLSTADELFLNGKILPLEIKKKVGLIPPQPAVSSTENEKKVSLKEILAMKDDRYHHHNPSSKPFWQFTRSSSLNCDNPKSRSLIRSLSFLSRSNSTGSAPKFEKSLLPKNSHKQHLQKQTSTAKCDKERSNVARSSTHNACNLSQKPPLKKKKKNDNHGSYYGNGIKISPVLNLPPHYISIRSVSLFGFGSLFCNAKNKKKKK